MNRQLFKRKRRGARVSHPSKEPVEVAWNLEVEKLLPGGEGLARTPLGPPVFLARVVPGDRVSISEVLPSKSFFRAHRFEVLKGGEARVEARCQHYQECGGCDWMSLSFVAQEQQKLALLNEALRRTGGFDLDLLPNIQWNSSPRKQSYRRRIRLGLRGAQLGFRKQKSHELVSLTSCDVAREELEPVIAWLIKLVAAQPLVAQCAYEVELALIGSIIELHFFIKSKTEPRLAQFRSLLQQHAESAPASTQWSFSVDSHKNALNRLPLMSLVKAASDRKDLIWTYLAPGGFAQVNEEGNRLMIQAVLNVAARENASTFLDVFCGSGNFSFPLAANGLRGIGVEFEPMAIYAAKKAAKEQGRALEFHAADAATFIRSLLQTESCFDLIVIDPPRAGAKDLISLLAKLSHRILVYVSCDPVTLARDLRKLAEYGFEVIDLHAFDLFPETHHVESLAVLRAPKAPQI